MKTLPRPLLAATLAIGFAGGAYLVTRDAPAQPYAVVVTPEQQQRAAAAAAASSGHAPRTNDVMAAEAQAAELRQKYKALERELQAVRAAADAGLPLPPESETKTFQASAPGAGPDAPLPFPKDAPEPYTPKGFEKVSHRAAKECGMGLDVVAVDCSEFPCIAWTRAMDDSVKRFSMADCGPWQEAFKYGTVVVGSIQQGDGGTGARYFSWMAVPPDPNDLLIAVKRAKERNADMKAALGIP